MRPSHLFSIAWIGWGVIWAVAAFWSNRTEKRVPTRQAWICYVVIAAGVVLLWPNWAARALGAKPLWNLGLGGAYGLAGLTFVGLLFACWARWHLGRLWSGTITRKEEHYIVDTGPYALVRHPIYTGLIGGIIATAVADATATALGGSVLVAFGLSLKARAEECFLSAELGSEVYSAYQRHVPMLVPFASHRR
jgi:protein-S-isoprenylcysteine O-methyltransferase Ste14